MKKKNYEVPSMKVVKIRQMLLAASPGADIEDGPNLDEIDPND